MRESVQFKRIFGRSETEKSMASRSFMLIFDSGRLGIVSLLRLRHFLHTWRRLFFVFLLWLKINLSIPDGPLTMVVFIECEGC